MDETHKNTLMSSAEHPRLQSGAREFKSLCGFMRSPCPVNSRGSHQDKLCMQGDWSCKLPDHKIQNERLKRKFISFKSQHANSFRKPFCQATEQYLTVKRGKIKCQLFICLWLRCPVYEKKNWHDSCHSLDKEIYPQTFSHSCVWVLC